MKFIFTFEIVHMLHLGFPILIKECIITYFSSDDMSHPDSLCGKRKNFGYKIAYYLCAHFYIGSNLTPFLAPGLHIDFYNHEPSSHINIFIITDGIRVITVK